MTHRYLLATCLIAGLAWAQDDDNGENIAQDPNDPNDPIAIETATAGDASAVEEVARDNDPEDPLLGRLRGIRADLQRSLGVVSRGLFRP